MIIGHLNSMCWKILSGDVQLTLSRREKKKKFREIMFVLTKPVI